MLLLISTIILAIIILGFTTIKQVVNSVKDNNSFGDNMYIWFYGLLMMNVVFIILLHVINNYVLTNFTGVEGPKGYKGSKGQTGDDTEIIIKLSENKPHNKYKCDIQRNCFEREKLLNDNGESYRGHQDRTVSGKRCQKWTEQAPHKHSNTPNSKPGKGLGDHNYCRNPDGSDTIWCYTNDRNKKWEFCEPKKCGNVLKC
jgi:hypothetical protein